MSVSHTDHLTFFLCVVIFGIISRIWHLQFWNLLGDGRTKRILRTFLIEIAEIIALLVLHLHLHCGSFLNYLDRFHNWSWDRWSHESFHWVLLCWLVLLGLCLESISDRLRVLWCLLLLVILVHHSLCITSTCGNAKSSSFFRCRWLGGLIRQVSSIALRIVEIELCLLGSFKVWDVLQLCWPLFWCHLGEFLRAISGKVED